MEPELLVTLWPSFSHFPRFAADDRLAGIRLNSAMMGVTELDKELALMRANHGKVPLWFDVKGRQLRVTEVEEHEDHLAVRLNHPIIADTPVLTLFKAGGDKVILDHVEDDGRLLVFRGWPKYKVIPGESLHIRDPALKVEGDLFTEIELEKIAKVKASGLTKWFLSYVESQRDVDQFLELVGRDAEVFLKIENQAGLAYVANEFRPSDNIRLLAARGDMYVEVDRPHEILAATKLIIEKDPRACVGSRILLSVIHDSVASCSDWSELAWLKDIGYTSMMLCDELCLKGDLLARAVNAFEAFRKTYR